MGQGLRKRHRSAMGYVWNDQIFDRRQSLECGHDETGSGPAVNPSCEFHLRCHLGVGISPAVAALQTSPTNLNSTPSSQACATIKNSTATTPNHQQLLTGALIEIDSLAFAATSTMSSMPATQGHSTPCCNVPPVVANGYKPRGAYEEIGGYKTCMLSPEIPTYRFIVRIEKKKPKPQISFFFFFKKKGGNWIADAGVCVCATSTCRCYWSFGCYQGYPRHLRHLWLL